VPGTEHSVIGADGTARIGVAGEETNQRREIGCSRSALNFSRSQAVARRSSRSRTRRLRAPSRRAPDNWRGWYTRNIPIADDRFDAHQAKVTEKSAKKPAATSKSAKKKGRRR
jgi:hypothetical protein